MKPLEFQQDDSGVVVSLPSAAPDPINSVVVMHVDGPLDITQKNEMLADDGSLILKAAAAYLHNNEGAAQIRVKAADIPNLSYWSDPQAWIEWSVDFEQAGTYEVFGEIAIEATKTRFRVGLGQNLSLIHI